jgi:hypothetical protein
VEREMGGKEYLFHEWRGRWERGWYWKISNNKSEISNKFQIRKYKKANDHVIKCQGS